MAIFDGRYRWDGTKKGDDEPIAWSPGAYDLKIFKRSTSSDNIQHLKPFVCIYAPTGEGQSISANPDKFAKQICNDFSLDIERVLWVEDMQKDEDRYEIVMFSKSWKMGNITFYKNNRRIASNREVMMIRNELSELKKSAYN